MLELGSNFASLRTENAKNTGIFFCPVTERICTVQSDAEQATVSTRSLHDEHNSFTIKEKGTWIRAISFAPDLRVVCLQQEDNIVELYCLDESGQAVVGDKFRQCCRFEGALILGVHFVSARQLALVEDAGCEFYLVNAHKRTLKLIKTLALSVNWFSYNALSSLFVFASGLSNNILTCALFQNNSPYTIGKLEVDFGCSRAKPRLLERDVLIASIYGNVCILALQFEPERGLATGLCMHEFGWGAAQLPELRHRLRFDLVGLVGLHVVDNLICVHNKDSQTTLVFDVALDAEKPICATKLRVSAKLEDALQRLQHPQANNNAASSTVPLPFLYGTAWKMYAPCYVLDLYREVYTAVGTDLSRAHEHIGDVDRLAQFLINRADGEHQLLALLQDIVLHKRLKYTTITQLFRQILRNEATEQSQESASVRPKWFVAGAPFSPLTVHHGALLRALFEPLQQRPEMDRRALANLMVDFFLALQQKQIKVQETYISELLIKILVDAGDFDRLQQLLQYAVIEKSKFLAYELIALSSRCTALCPIALDMLKRRRDWEQIVDVLAGRGQLVEALRLLIEKGDAQQQRIERTHFSKLLRKLLERAWKSDDRMLMFTVYAHIHHALGKKALAELLPSDDFERYQQEFKLLYDTEEVAEAERRFRLARLSSIRRRSDCQQREDSFTSTGEETAAEESGRTAPGESTSTSS